MHICHFWFSFSLVSRFKWYPSWQYWNKCQSLMCIYWIKQFQKKNADKPNLLFFLSRKYLVWCLSVQLSQTRLNQTHKKENICYHQNWWLWGNAQQWANDCISSSAKIFATLRPKQQNVFILFFPIFFPFSALTACICNKCVWLSLFASVFFRFHKECRKNLNWACLSGSCCSHTRQGFYHGNESNDGFIQFYNYVMS